jgi:hypothetical protein
MEVSHGLWHLLEYIHFFFAKLNSYFAELQCLNFQKEWSVRCGLTIISIKDAVIDKYVVIFFSYTYFKLLSSLSCEDDKQK